VCFASSRFNRQRNATPNPASITSALDTFHPAWAGYVADPLPLAALGRMGAEEDQERFAGFIANPQNFNEYIVRPE